VIKRILQHLVRSMERIPGPSLTASLPEKR
jgi:hypothetical protein